MAPVTGAPLPRESSRFDPWSGRGASGLRWFAVSTLLHVAALALLATVSLTVIRAVEKIKVRVIDSEAAAPPEVETAPSLEDLAGVLDVAVAPRQRARPSGPVVRNLRAPELPRLGGIGPKLGTAPDLAAATVPLSLGSGGIGGLGGGFGDYVGGLRKTGLDLALVVDTTDSMQFVLDELKVRLANLVGAIQRMVPATRIGIVIYRDQGDEYVVKWTDLSFRTAKLQEFLSHIRAAGGGDWEEGVKEGIEAAIGDLSWRKKSKRVIILVAGSPPHARDMEEVARMLRSFRAAGGATSAVDVTQAMHAAFERETWRSLHGDAPFAPSEMPEFYKETARACQTMAETGGGELVRLSDDRSLIRDVVMLTFGSRWKTEMAKYLKDLS